TIIYRLSNNQKSKMQQQYILIDNVFLLADVINLVAGGILMKEMTIPGVAFPFMEAVADVRGLQCSVLAILGTDFDQGGILISWKKHIKSWWLTCIDENEKLQD
ncbi:hypothetical protein ACJX0J_034881, partial [Zea mays]